MRLQKSSEKQFFPLVNGIFIILWQVENWIPMKYPYLNTHKQPSPANICKPSCSVTKLSHSKAHKSAHKQLHHDRGVDTNNVSANHLRYKLNHLWWKCHVKKFLFMPSYFCKFSLLLISLSSNFDFICNNNKQVYFVKMHPTMSSEYFRW